MKITPSLFATPLLLSSLTMIELSHADIIIGNDLNSNVSSNSAINPLFAGNRGTNGGGDQSLQFGDNLQGTYNNDIIIGGLGIDVLFGHDGDDILLGGTEDFNGFNRDRAFGNNGNDTFIWAPGDGNDFFDGGEGEDVLVIGLVGESRDDNGDTDGAPFFNVTPPNKIGSKDFDGIYINPHTQLPVVDIAGGPGFCEILDSSTDGVNDLNLDHLVRFTLRGPANTFDNTIAEDPSVDPDTLDTGLRISVHLRNTEFLVCGSHDGSEVEVFDLRQSPAIKINTSYLPARAYKLVQPL